MRVSIDDLLRELVSREASDLHIKAGLPPVMRIHGKLIHTDHQALSDEETEELLRTVLNDERWARLESFKELDLSYEVHGLSRFRVNMFWARGSLGAVFRVIPFKVKTIDELGIPSVTKKLSLLPRGLILVTGPTGSGKSTTLAAMVDHINMHRRLHIMTIEDPIEYMHTDKVSVINQRELGVDTHSFADALRHVMRQNPDVILVGEMRDLETIQLAITAAETGHLVMSTLHTTDAAQTIDRMVDVFPPDQQAQIRTQVSVTLQAVISQTLVPTKDGHGRIAAFEVLVATPAVRTLIRDGKTHQLYMDIQTGAEHGMQTLDGHLLGLLKDGVIDYENAIAKSQAPAEFQRRAINLGLLEAPASG
ncbi:MAG: Twitching mobility protein [Fimbriimonadales bacterium]|nr:MAG: type IV pilus twitching motility protein PilT [Armatimonadota bacterium]MBV6501985.1 Twitching mobility protein [Fimbriimonadales bacterium]MCE7898821.1 type IV pilus twitching motility protein PilT [Armatimonadetes bacterium ATM1]MDL1928885.1 type IV pilus twitching motility protein PilT [Fimbriimonadia bacterium ATM]MBC6969552.1 type IV pilus twitching motility protein PilT [Armatimonadota bacterium]